MYLVIRKSDTEQLLHHFASGYQIDQRNVFRMEEMAENKTCQPAGRDIIADDLRHTEKRCLKRSRPRCDQRRITMAEERIGFAEHDLHIRVADILPVIFRFQAGSTGNHRLVARIGGSPSSAWSEGCL